MCIVGDTDEAIALVVDRIHEDLEVAIRPLGPELQRFEQYSGAVLSDIRMPRMNGLEMTRRIRVQPDLAELPVLLVTSMSSEDDRREGLRSGATGYLVKGVVTPDQVVETLRGFVS